MARIGGIFLKPGFAYLIVLLLIYPAYRGVVRKPTVQKEVLHEKETIQVPKPFVGIGTARDFSLGTGRGGNSKGHKEVVISGNGGFFSLSFFIPVQNSPQVQYDLTVASESGELVASQSEIISRDGLGNFTLVCRNDLFKDGYYVLKVSRVDKRLSRKVYEHNFRFKIVRSLK